MRVKTHKATSAMYHLHIFDTSDIKFCLTSDNPHVPARKIAKLAKQIRRMKAIPRIIHV